MTSGNNPARPGHGRASDAVGHRHALGTVVCIPGDRKRFACSYAAEVLVHTLSRSTQYPEARGERGPGGRGRPGERFRDGRCGHGGAS
jgi:hypothetical protein